MAKQALLPDFLSRNKEMEFNSLLELSAKLGSDRLLVQANNGNASLKLDGVLWIKASGKCLANATQEQTFVPVELEAIRTSLRHKMETAGSSLRTCALRPSIETAMHGVLPHAVVVHVHSINTIAWAIRADGPEQLEKRLAGLEWQWVPYVPSGVPLAKEIERLLHKAPETDVFVLGNHGLVVCGSDCESVEALLGEVERRVAVAPRLSPEPSAALYAVISRSARWKFPESQALHALGTDAISRGILRKGVLFPCQVIFLGPKLAALPCSVPLSRLESYFGDKSEAPPYAIVEGGGVILNQHIHRAEYETLLGIMEVVQRVDACAPIRYLTEAEVANILSDGTHSYRDSVLAGDTRQMARAAHPNS